MRTDRIVVEITGSGVAVTPDASRPPLALPAAPGATTLADLVLADAGGRGAFERMPRLTLRVTGTSSGRLVGFLAMPDGTAAVRRLDEVDGGVELASAIAAVGTRVLLLEFPTAADADAFVGRVVASAAPGAGRAARGEPAPGAPLPRPVAAQLHAEMKPVAVV
ncbi:MAG TPA: hypothetical protein VFS72_13445, partial [Agromyces sp.]|nr:hypothetical protein [Agromyces sp.]